jgi:hypothetical protein
MAPSFLFGVEITTDGRIVGAIAAVFLGLSHLLKPLFHSGLNGSRQISHLLVAPKFWRWLRTCGLTSGCGHGIAIPVVPAALLGVVSQVGPALCLAVLAKLAGLALLWDLLVGIPRARMLLRTSLGDVGTRRILCLCLVDNFVLLFHDMLDWFYVLEKGPSPARKGLVSHVVLVQPKNRHRVQDDFD